MKYTFLELQKQYKIVIPQIQRDYAQGRIDKFNEGKIKSYDFIVKLIEVLTTDKSALNLDFVYGYTREISKSQTAFIPLDGQQRLTTLWLLHWFLSPKQEIDKDDIKMFSVESEVKSWLQNFTYETRNSSKRFCEELIESSLSETTDICATIKDASWFMASWKNDPTVVSMLNMLEAIQQQNFNKETAWQNLVENKKITFDYIDIKSDEFKLTDELYIKMNSRGKPLTSFENFKAQFTEILLTKDTDYFNEKLDFEGTQVSYQEYFSFKIDSVWTDLFWNFSLAQHKDISSCFMNFFTYIAQMCYFKDNSGKQASDFNLYNNDFSKFNIFTKKENILILFNALDFFYKISIDEHKQVQINKIDTLFSNLFLKGKIDSTYQGEVRLFEEGTKGINLFTKCLEEGNTFDNRNRIILFCLIQYAVKYNIEEVNDGLRHYIRVVRNLLQATRQKDQKKETTYATNVRVNHFGTYWKLFKQLLNGTDVYQILFDHNEVTINPRGLNMSDVYFKIDNSGTNIRDFALKNEKEKAEIIKNSSISQDIITALFQLEESEHFGGLIHLLKPKDNYLKFPDYVKAMTDFWEKDVSDVLIRALIACDFGGFYTKDCRLGEMRVFGQWNTIFSGDSDENENISNSIISLLDTYISKTTGSITEKLNSIITDKLNNLTDRNWQYYFLKYPKMLQKGNYFSWNNDFEIETLQSESNNPLLAYHINPYVFVVSNKLNNKICEEGYCWSRYSDVSEIRLFHDGNNLLKQDELWTNGIRLICKEMGWKIVLPQNSVIDESIKTKYNIDTDLLLKETKDKDRIEIAVDFCNELVK
jgi:hypothetical protein